MDQQTQDVVDGVGDFIEYWGFKKIQGRIWALIFLAGEPVNASYLIENLKVSKALVSMSLKELLEYDVILIDTKKTNTTNYISNPNLSDVIVNVILGREAKMLLKIKSSCELLARRSSKSTQETLVSKKRVARLNKMVSTADNTLKTFISIKQLNFKDLSRSLDIL